MQIKPTKDRVVILLDKKATETASGLALGAPACEYGDAYLTGVVVATGPGGYGYPAGLIDERRQLPKQKFFEVDGVVVGDRVLIEKLSGDPIDTKTTGVGVHPKSADHDEYRIVTSSEIVMVLGEAGDDNG
jgi:co-chaperonin GroES (HSP10)